MNGTSAADTLTGSEVQDEIGGGEGDDLIYGANEFGPWAFLFGDALAGGGGNDTVDGGYGGDWIVGGAGDDSLLGYMGDDILVGAGGPIRGAGQSFINDPFDGPLVFNGFAIGRADWDDGVPDVLNGENGNDLIVAGVGDTAFAGSGSDLLWVTLRSKDASVILDLSIDYLGRLSAAMEGQIDWQFDIIILTATDLDDQVSGTAFLDLFDGACGHDLLKGLDGDDYLIGGDGRDTLIGGDGADMLFGGRQHPDWVRSRSSADSVVDELSGGAGADLLKIGRGDIAHGGSGEDRMIADFSGFDAALRLTLSSEISTIGDLLGAQIVDVEALSSVTLSRLSDRVQAEGTIEIRGGDGDDALIGSHEAQVLSGDSGNDSLIGAEGADTLDGGAGADVARGGAGDDLIYAAQGDTIYAGAGADRVVLESLPAQLDGGAGRDVLVLSGVITRFLGAEGFELVKGAARGTGGRDILDLRSAGAPSDTGVLYRALGGIDRAFGSGGHDDLDGGDGQDTLRGGDGNDNLASFDEDADVLIGDEGADYIWLRSGDLAKGGAGNDRIDKIFGGSGVTMLGGEGDDDLQGDWDDLLSGGLGDDRIWGGGGILYGGRGDDLLVSQGRASIDGGRGDDVILAGGADLIAGGDGRDRFVFGKRTASPPENPTIIVDLQDHDVIDLRDIWFSGELEIVEELTGWGGEVTLKFDDTSGLTRLVVDLDGGREADLLVLIEGNHVDPDSYLL